MCAAITCSQQIPVCGMHIYACIAGSLGVTLFVSSLVKVRRRRFSDFDVTGMVIGISSGVILCLLPWLFVLWVFRHEKKEHSSHGNGTYSSQSRSFVRSFVRTPNSPHPPHYTTKHTPARTRARTQEYTWPSVVSSIIISDVVNTKAVCISLYV